MTIRSEKSYEAIISSAYLFRMQGAYGSFEKAISALMKRKSIIVDCCDRSSCEKDFEIALKVVDDALDFENRFIKSSQVKKTSSSWVDQGTMQQIAKQLEEYLRDKNPDAPTVFIERSIGRITYFYHLA